MNRLMQPSHALWKPQKFDLALSAAIAGLFPVLAGLLYSSSGALLPMILYYGLAWGLVIWRRGSSGYFNPWPERITPYFYLNLCVIFAALVCAYLSRNAFPDSTRLGILATALIWAPLNAASEQLLWISCLKPGICIRRNRAGCFDPSGWYSSPFLSG